MPDLKENMTVWKFPVNPVHGKDCEFSVNVPRGARVLTFGHDETGQLKAWAEITDPTETKMFQQQHFLFVPTGDKITASCEREYMMTLFVPSQLGLGQLVFHAYRLPSDA